MSAVEQAWRAYQQAASAANTAHVPELADYWAAVAAVHAPAVAEEDEGEPEEAPE